MLSVLAPGGQEFESGAAAYDQVEFDVSAPAEELLAALVTGDGVAFEQDGEGRDKGRNARPADWIKAKMSSVVCGWSGRVPVEGIRLCSLSCRLDRQRVSL